MTNYLIKEGDQFVGVFNLSDPPNEFIWGLMAAADEAGGEASLPDPEGCMVTATRVDDQRSWDDPDNPEWSEKMFSRAILRKNRREIHR